MLEFLALISHALMLKADLLKAQRKSSLFIFAEIHCEVSGDLQEDNKPG